MAKRLLITGSAGFVGSHTVEHILKNTDWEIIGLDSFRHAGDSERVIKDKRYTMFGCDLSTPISRRLRYKIGEVDYIINMASMSDVELSIREPEDFVKNNYNLALYMLEFARTQPRLEKYIQISTDEVFGAALEGYNHTEWEHYLPSNPYSASKASQVMLSIAWWRAYGVPIILTQTMNIIGEKQDTTKFLPMLIKKINNGEEVEIHGTPEYIGKRKYLHARNQADALLFILRNIEPTKYYDTTDKILKPDNFNIVGDIELDNLELAQMVAKIIGKPLKYKLTDFHKARAGHDRRYSLDGSKIASFGWKAPVSFYDSLKKTVLWTTENKEWLL